MDFFSKNLSINSRRTKRLHDSFSSKSSDYGIKSDDSIFSDNTEKRLRGEDAPVKTSFMREYVKNLQMTYLNNANTTSPLTIEPDDSPSVSPSSVLETESFQLEALPDDTQRSPIPERLLKSPSAEKHNTFLENEFLLDEQLQVNKQPAAKYTDIRSTISLAQDLTLEPLQINKVPEDVYSDEYKQECLALYFRNSKLYKRKLMVKHSLPSPQILLKFLRKIKVGNGSDNEKFFSMLKMKVDCFPKHDRFCSLLVDEIKLKSHLYYAIDIDSIVGLENIGTGEKIFKPALSATVFMLRGIKSKWNQPLTYRYHHSSFPEKKLKIIVLDLIRQLQKIGLKVCVLITSTSSSNIFLSRSLRVTPTRPYFYVNKEKISYMFDTPHIMKDIRNNLLQYNIQLNHGQKVCWKYIYDCYIDNKNKTPKLSEAHVNPTQSEKKKTKLATQVFSQTVASTLNNCIQHEQLPDSALATAEFVEMLDNLFDILNSSLQSDGNIFKTAFRGDAYQIEFLYTCCEYFKNIRLIDKSRNDVTNQVNFMECLELSINGLLHLWSKLESNGFSYILTRRLNQDTLERFFISTKQYNGLSMDPIPIQFHRMFKKFVCLTLFDSGIENCKGDYNEILQKLNDIPAEDYTVAIDISSEPVIDFSYKVYNIEQLDHQRVIPSYLLLKCLDIHKCDICEDYANKVHALDDSDLICYYKTCEDGTMDSYYDDLTMPDNNFIIHISYLEVVFQQNFERVSVLSNILSKLIESSDSIEYIHPCGNFPYMYLKKLYFRVRLFFTLTLINRNFKIADNIITWRNE